MTFNIVLFLLTAWYSQKVQAGLEPHVLSVFCVPKVEDFFFFFFVRCINAAFVSHKGQKVSNVTMYHLIYEV